MKHRYYSMGPTAFCAYHNRLIPFCYYCESYECDMPMSAMDEQPNIVHINGLAPGGRFGGPVLVPKASPKKKRKPT